jgi:hypothetical protein
MSVRRSRRRRWIAAECSLSAMAAGSSGSDFTLATGIYLG